MERTMKLFGLTRRKKLRSHSQSREDSSTGGSGNSGRGDKGSSHGSSAANGSSHGFDGNLGSPVASPEYRENLDSRFQFTSEGASPSGSARGSLQAQMPSPGGAQLKSRRSISSELERTERSPIGSPGSGHPAYLPNGNGHMHVPHSAQERSPFASERAVSQVQPLGRAPAQTTTLGAFGITHAIEGAHSLMRQQSEPIGFAAGHGDEAFQDVYESQSMTPARTDWTDNNLRVDFSGASTSQQRSPRGYAAPFSPAGGPELHPLPTPPPAAQWNVARPGRCASMPQILPTPPTSPPRPPPNPTVPNHPRGDLDARCQLSELVWPDPAHGSKGVRRRREVSGNPALALEGPVQSFELPPPPGGTPLPSPPRSPHRSPPWSPCMSPRQGSPPGSPTAGLQPTRRPLQRSPQISSHHRWPHQSPSRSPGPPPSVSSRGLPQASPPRLASRLAQVELLALTERSAPRSPTRSPLLRSPHQSPLLRSPHESPPRSLQLDERRRQRLPADGPQAPPSPTLAPQPPKRWSKGQVLGRGSFGVVYEALNLDDGSFFAVKVSDNETIPPEVQQEVAVLSKLRHPNIVQYLGTSMENNCLCIFLELVKMGSLQSIMKNYHHFNEILISMYTRQILKGLEYLHGKNTVHRDIKCANILVDGNGQVKLADFGLAKTMERSLATSFKGTPFYMAPEVMKPAKNNRSYGLAVDIWSLGCTVLEMAQGKPPWSELGFGFFFKVSRGELPPIPDHLGSEARDFILQCLRLNPEERPTASQLLEHPFVTNAPPTLEEAASVMEPSSTFPLNVLRKETNVLTPTNRRGADSLAHATMFSTTCSNASSSTSSRDEDYCHHLELEGTPWRGTRPQ